MWRLFACPHCRRTIQIPPSLTTQATVRCPSCGQPFLVPAPAYPARAVGPTSRNGDRPGPGPPPPATPRYDRFSCLCGKILKARPELAGKRTQCTACGQVLRIPPSRAVGTAGVVRPPVEEAAVPAAQAPRPPSDKPRGAHPAPGRPPAMSRASPANQRPRRAAANEPRSHCLGVIAGTAATLWLNSVQQLLGWFTGPSSLAPLAAAPFLGSVFGGMCTSTLTGVARFRHSLYASLWAFVVQLVFAVPLSSVLVARFADRSSRFLGGERRSEHDCLPRPGTETPKFGPISDPFPDPDRDGLPPRRRWTSPEPP